METIFFVCITIVMYVVIAIVLHISKEEDIYRAKHTQQMYPSVSLASTCSVEVTYPPSIVDGVACNQGGTRVLLKDQIHPYENGIYVVLSQDRWKRAEDFDNKNKITDGGWVYVRNGKKYGKSMWTIEFGRASCRERVLRLV